MACRMSDELEVAAVAPLVDDVRALIDGARRQAASAVNAELTLLYWRVGRRIHAETLRGRRAEYGKQIVGALSSQLRVEYGRAFEEKNLRRMMQFAEAFPDEAIVVSLIRQLSWTHFIALIPMQDPIQRDFYTQMCSLESWSVRQLRERISSMLFERTAISRKPDETILHDLKELREAKRVSPELLLKDPYVLDFLGVKDRYLEKDLEDAILREIEAFLLELGAGFTFVARQKRLQIDGDDFYIDLLFYNRRLRRLVAVDLKIGEFRAEYKGQMELYLRWLAKHEQEPGEETPLGVILCAGKKDEQMELLELGKSGIHVAEYLTVLPPREILQERLHASVETARRRMLEDREEEGIGEE